MCVIETRTYHYASGRQQTVEVPRLCSLSHGTRPCADLEYTQRSVTISDPGSPSFSLASPTTLSNPPTPITRVREVVPSGEHSRSSSETERKRRSSKSYPSIKPGIIIRIGGSNKREKERGRDYKRRSGESAVYSSCGSSEVLAANPPSERSSPRTTTFRTSAYAGAGPSTAAHAPPPPPPPRNRPPTAAASPDDSPPPDRRRRRRYSTVVHNDGEGHAPEILDRGEARERARNEERQRRQRADDETARITRENIRREQEDARREANRANARENQRQHNRLERERSDRTRREEEDHRRRRESNARADERARFRDAEPERLRTAERPHHPDPGRPRHYERQRHSEPPLELPLGRRPSNRRRRSNAAQQDRPDLRETHALMAQERAAAQAQTRQEALIDAHRNQFNPRYGAGFAPPLGPPPGGPLPQPYATREVVPRPPPANPYVDPLLAHGEQVLQQARDERARNASRSMHNAFNDLYIDGGAADAGFGGSLSRSNTGRRGRDSYYEGGGP